MSSVSPVQAAAIMLCFSFARLAAFRPDGDSLLICAAAEMIVGVIIAAVCAILPQQVSVRSRTVRRLCALLSAVWLILVLTLMFTDLADSLRYSFPDLYSAPAVIAAAAAAAAYCASMGLVGCGRAACAAAVLTGIILLLTALGAVGGFDPDFLNLAVPRRGDMLARQLLRSFSRAAELPAAAVMLRHRTERPRSAGFIRFGGSSLAWGGLLTLCAGVLGDRALSGIPADTLSSYSKTSVIERFDALMLLAWTLCLLISAAALMLALSECAAAFGEGAARYAPAVSAVICGGGACLLTGRGAALPAGLSAGLIIAACIAGLFIGGRGKATEAAA